MERQTRHGKSTRWLNTNMARQQNVTSTRDAESVIFIKGCSKLKDLQKINVQISTLK